MTTKNPTIYDVAKSANVSITTVVPRAKHSSSGTGKNP